MKHKNSKMLPWIYVQEDPIYFEHISTLWIKRYNYKGLQSTKTTYICKNHSRYNCKALLRKEQSNDGKIQIFKAFEHENGCLQPDNLVNKINMRDKVINLYNFGVKKPFDILNIIKNDTKTLEDNMTVSVPNVKQIYNIIERERSKIKKKSVGVTTDNIEYKCKCLLNSNLFEQPFVINYTMNPIKILISSKLTLSRLHDAKTIHIDATYRLTLGEFPVIVLGFSDLNGSFKFIAIAIVSTESTESYSWVLSSLLEYNVRNNIGFSPNVFIADNSAAISSAIQRIFPFVKRVHCWAHTWRLMEQLFKGIPLFKEIISKEIHFLQSLYEEQLFRDGLRLFLQKWSQIDIIAPYIKEFENKHCKINSNWYEAYSIFNPSTNNCLERFNQTIKSRYTNWLRHDLLAFIDICINITKDHNEESYLLDKMKYNEPTLDNVEAYKNSGFYLVKSNDNGSIFNFQSEEIGSIKKDNLITTFMSSFSTFNDFYEFYSKNIFLSVYYPIESWRSVICSCMNFVKHKKCIHVYLYLKQHNLLGLININLLINRRSRGRPKKVKQNTSLNKDIV
jgi:hypothetical protein